MNGVTINLPRFYGKPVDCPSGHKWSGYAADAPTEYADPITGELVIRATGYPTVPAPQPLRSLRLA